MRLKFIAALFMGALLFPFSPAMAAGTVDAAMRHQVIEQLAQQLTDIYVFPDRAQTAVTALRSAEQAGTFNSITDADAFAKAVTENLAATLHDKHLHLEYSADALPPDQGPDGPPSAQQQAQMRAFFASMNYGLAKAIRLRGNVGYLDVRAFPPAASAAQTLAAAMQFLSNTDALIIDLRQNGGGDPGGVAQLFSYFYPKGANVHINDIYKRTPKTTTGKTKQFFTMDVTGPPYLGKPIYVLTGPRTFSGGEEFAYDMLTHKRATLVGEVTGGGANPGGDVRLTDHFSAFIPTGRAVNPITGTNWEGVGVHPNVATSASAALQTAYLTILRSKLAAAANDDDRTGYTQLIDQITKNPETILTQ